MSRGQAGRAAQSAKCLCVTCHYGAAMRSIHLDALDRPAVLSLQVPEASSSGAERMEGLP